MFKKIFFITYNVLLYLIFIAFLIFIISLISHILYVNCMENEELRTTIKVFVIPYLIFILLDFFVWKYKKLWLHIIKFIYSILAVLYLLLSSLFILSTIPEAPEHPTIKQYHKTIEYVRQSYPRDDLNYFPDNIPSDVSDFGTDFQYGAQEYYVYFNANKKYTDTIKDIYKDRIVEIMPATDKTKDLFNIYLIHEYKLPKTANVYMLQNSNYDFCEKCKYGFAIDEETNFILFFSKYNLN